MRRTILAAVSACLLAGGVPHAQAQHQPSSMPQGWNSASAYYLEILRVQQQGFTPQELDRMSQQRMQERGRVDHGPPPPLSSVPKLRIFKPAEPWICKSTNPWQPVYSEPRLGAPTLGETQSQVAVGGRSQNGFARILFPNGKIGWIPANQVRDFVSDVRPGLTCQVEGVRANGGPVFGIE